MSEWASYAEARILLSLATAILQLSFSYPTAILHLARASYAEAHISYVLLSSVGAQSALLAC